MTASPSTAERQPVDKPTLFCPDCDHVSRINGDWLIHVHAESVTYECPHCGTVIDSRRKRTTLTPESDGSLHFAAEH